MPDALATAARDSRWLASGLTEAVSSFVAGRQPFLAELSGLGRSRSLDPTRLAAFYGDASAILDRLLLRFSATHQLPDATGRESD